MDVFTSQFRGRQRPRPLSPGTGTIPRRSQSRSPPSGRRSTTPPTAPPRQPRPLRPTALQSPSARAPLWRLWLLLPDLRRVRWPMRSTSNPARPAPLTGSGFPSAAGLQLNGSTKVNSNSSSLLMEKATRPGTLFDYTGQHPILHHQLYLPATAPWRMASPSPSRMLAQPRLVGTGDTWATDRTLSPEQRAASPGVSPSSSTSITTPARAPIPRYKGRRSTSNGPGGQSHPLPDRAGERRYHIRSTCL